MILGTRSSGWLQQMVGKGTLRELSPWQQNRGHNGAVFVAVDLILTCRFNMSNWGNTLCQYVSVIVDTFHMLFSQFVATN